MQGGGRQGRDHLFGCGGLTHLHVDEQIGRAAELRPPPPPGEKRPDDASKRNAWTAGAGRCKGRAGAPT